jgi:hypothetical protein
MHIPLKSIAPPGYYPSWRGQMIIKALQICFDWIIGLLFFHPCPVKWGQL